MAGFLGTLFDALLPRHADARVAAGLTAEALWRLASPVKARGAYAVFPYREGRVRAMIRAIKYYGETGVLKPLGAVASEHLAGLLDDEGLERRSALIVPVPASPARLRRRGYNQAERIARAIHAALPEGLAGYVPDLLARYDRETQVRARTSRTKNIQGAFYVPEYSTLYGTIRGSKIILIDDVVKTGATIRDATRALKEAGAQSVTAFAIAY